MTQNKALSAKQHRAIPVLLTQPNVSRAAEALGIGRTTLQRWLNQDDFKAALQAAEAEALSTLSRVMAGHAVKPLAVLISIMDDPAVPAGVRVRAASSFLAILLRYRELITLEQRLERIEQSLNLRGPNEA